MSDAFDTLCNQVTNTLLKNVNHLARGTRTILKTTELTNVPPLIGKKNFTLTSDSHLAAILIKVIMYYVNAKFSDEKKQGKLSEYIYAIKENNSFIRTTVPAILKYLQTKNKNCSNFIELVRQNTNNILVKAKKLLNTITITETDTDIYKKKFIDIEQLTKDISDDFILQDNYTDMLKLVLDKIKNICKHDFTSKKQLKDAIVELFWSNGNLSTSSAWSSCPQPVWERIAPEVNYLRSVVNKERDSDEKLKKCRKNVVGDLLTAKKRIVRAYEAIDKANDATNEHEKEKKSSSSSSSESSPSSKESPASVLKNTTPGISQDDDGPPELGPPTTDHPVPDENGLVIDTVDAILKTEKLQITEIKAKLTELATNDQIVVLKPALEKVNKHLALEDFDKNFFLKKDALKGISDEAYKRLKTLFYRAKRISIVNKFNKLLNEKWTNHIDLTGKGTVNTFLHVIYKFSQQWPKNQNPIDNTYTYIYDIAIDKHWDFINDIDKNTAVKKEVGPGNLNIINNNLLELRDANTQSNQDG